MAPPLLPFVRPLIAVPVAIRAANTIMGLMVMQGITMSMWRGMLNRNIPSVDMRSSRPHLTFEMTNRQTTPPPHPVTSAPNAAAAVDGHHHHSGYHHSHSHEDDDYDEEFRPKRKHRRKQIKVLQMIPIVQPMIPIPLTSHSPTTHSIPVSIQPLNQEQQPLQPQQQQLLSYQTLEQASQSPVLVIPAFGQRQGTTSRILIQPLTDPSTGSASVTETSASPPLSRASGSAIMIMTSASSPRARYQDRGIHADGSGGGSAAVHAKKSKRKTEKKVIVLSIKGEEAHHQQGSGITGRVSERHDKSCTPYDATCHRDTDKNASIAETLDQEVDHRHDRDAGDGDVGKGQTFLSQGNDVPEKAIADKDYVVPLSSSSLSSTLSLPDVSNKSDGTSQTPVTNSVGSEQSPSTKVKP